MRQAKNEIRNEAVLYDGPDAQLAAELEDGGEDEADEEDGDDDEEARHREFVFAQANPGVFPEGGALFDTGGAFFWRAGGGWGGHSFERIKI